MPDGDVGRTLACGVVCSALMRFGLFLAPFHADPGQSPTLALHQDVELICTLERLGYDEAWVGEHHSGGTEIITSPEVFLGYAAARTSRIRLGAGVVSLPYHNPLWVAACSCMTRQCSGMIAMPSGVSPVSWSSPAPKRPASSGPDGV